MVTVGIIGAGRIGKVHTTSICNLVKKWEDQDHCRSIYE